MKRSTALFFTLSTTILFVPLLQAHFRLLEPKSWVVENDLGNPQKPGPCGGAEGDAGVSLTNAVTKVQGGQKLHIKLMEVIFHPGHYRIALAVNSPSELPPDPDVVTKDTDKGPQSISTKIEPNPAAPLLADGLWPHTTKPTEAFETDVQLPNINCPKCTLQIVEFMAQHGYNKQGGYSYHHCAVLNINADPAKPIDTRWPAAK